jgi:hypothetical protein
MLRGSAICTRHMTVCLNSNCTETGTRNLCHMGELQAKMDLTMSIFLFIGLGVLSAVQKQVSAELDESVQSAQDYSVMVDDPGEDDTDPDDWQKYFQQFGHVTFVTVVG